MQNNDYQMREWLDFHKIPIITLATKTDTLSKNEAFRAIQNISKTLDTEVIEFSSKTGIGKDKILAVFTGIIKDSI